jgi:2'-5' RNA ligase
LTAAASAAEPAAWRYAVYFAPEPETPLARFGRTWLGYDPETGRKADRDTLGLDPALAAHVTAAPALYGLHATLKAPFRLHENRTAGALRDRLARLAASHRRFFAGRLELTRIGDFLALTPERRAEANRLAAHCLLGLDAFRAPLTPAERDHRNNEALTPYRRLLLELYGYPFVLGEYRFHITLTGALDDGERDIVEPALRAALNPLLAEPLEIASLCLFTQPAAGERFTVAGRWPLAA